MGNQSPPPPPRAVEQAPADRLNSWKEIAAYLQRDVSTVQRWEKREGMPVHRHVHDKLGSVFAFREELDQWWRSRSVRLGVETTPLADAPGEELTGDARPFVNDDPRDSPVRLRTPARRLAVLLVAGGAVAVAATVWLGGLTGHGWRDPLSNARFEQLTDFEGTEHAAAISRDGRFVAFLSDRDGPMDVWLTQAGTGQFHNLTRGALRELVNPDVRTLGFSPDASLVSLWMRRSGTANPADIGVWAIPTLGGGPRPYLEGVAEFDWSPDGARLVYHTPGPGDPLFVTEHFGQAKQPIWTAPPGLHAHFPVWSPDAAFIYFVYGTVPDGMDIYRLPATGGTPERITSHDSRVTHPTFLDERTLLYLASAPDGSGPWLHGLDITEPSPHRLNVGPGRFTSLAASADGRRLVVTAANPKGTLWRVRISDGVAEESQANRFSLPTTRGRSPRYGPDYLVYVSTRGDSDSIWKLANETATELWSAPGARVLGGPAISPTGAEVAFAAEERDGTRLYVMNADGSALRALAGAVQPRGSPAWAPDGRSIAVAADVAGEPRVVRVAINGGSASPLVSEYSRDPAWSLDGDVLLYSGRDVGTTFEVRAVTAGGEPHPMRTLTLSRGARRLAFLPQRRALVALRGEIDHKNFWLIDLDTGTERQLTNFGRTFIIRDFDVSPDGREIVFDQMQENSDLVLIERSAP